MNRRCLLFSIAMAVLPGSTANAAPTATVADARLVDDFVAAMTAYSTGEKNTLTGDVQQLWYEGFAERGISPVGLDKRLRKAKMGPYKIAGSDPVASFRQIAIEEWPTIRTEAIANPVALHAFRLDVVEDYDDVFNDNVYCYFITTHDDLVWGKVTSIYEGMDEGESFFLSPTDRGLFGPKGEKIQAYSHLIVDIGIVESDGEDIKQLQKLSDAIIDLAVVALTIYDSNAGAAAAQARAETKNLINLVLSMDDDDRLVADSLHLTQDRIVSDLGSRSFVEFTRFYERETFWTHFAYRLRFRLLQ